MWKVSPHFHLINWVFLEFIILLRWALRFESFATTFIKRLLESAPDSLTAEGKDQFQGLVGHEMERETIWRERKMMGQKESKLKASLESLNHISVVQFNSLPQTGRQFYPTI